MQIKRFKDIIAVQNDSIGGGMAGIVAFHASNMEVAEISQEAFEQMAPIDLLTGAPPIANDLSTTDDAVLALKEWQLEVNPNVTSGKTEMQIRSLTININQICNLKCSYCAAGGDGSYGEAMTSISVDKTRIQIDYFLSKLNPGQTFAVSFVGGEPLLHVQTLRLLHDYIVEKTTALALKYSIKVVTNGTLLTTETLAILKQLNIHLTISFDGTKEVNDAARPSKDGASTTEKILNGLNALKDDRGNIMSISFSSITTAQNLDVFENYLYLKKLEPDKMDFIFANEEKSVEAQASHISGLTRIIAHLWDEGGETAIRKLKPVDQYFRLLDEQQQVENFCGAGKSYLMVDAKNRLYTCVWDANDKSEVVGSATTIDEQKLHKLSKSLVELNNCQNCWARFMCGGGCMSINKSHTGDKHSKSILFCERTRSLISIVIMYYKLSRSVV